MKMIRQNVEGCVLIKNDVYDDERGLFFEVMNEEILNNLSVPKIVRPWNLNLNMVLFY